VQPVEGMTSVSLVLEEDEEPPERKLQLVVTRRKTKSTVLV
jgi:hypothetical protein